MLRPNAEQSSATSIINPLKEPKIHSAEVQNQATQILLSLIFGMMLTISGFELTCGLSEEQARFHYSKEWAIEGFSMSGQERTLRMKGPSPWLRRRNRCLCLTPQRCALHARWELQQDLTTLSMSELREKSSFHTIGWRHWVKSHSWIRSFHSYFWPWSLRARSNDLWKPTSRGCSCKSQHQEEQKPSCTLEESLCANIEWLPMQVTSESIQTNHKSIEHDPENYKIRRSETSQDQNISIREGTNRKPWDVNQ